MDEGNGQATLGGEQRLGETVRRLRTRQGLSVRTLAGRAGFSPSFISQVELGQASPSISSLERIAQALGVGLGEFFRTKTPTAVVRAGRRAGLASRWSRAEVEALGPTGAGRALEPMMLTLEPGGQSGGHPSGHGGEEFAIVFEGEVVLTLGDEVHRLGRGDAATFPAETPHRWENPGPAPARIVVVTAAR
ncbi:MAG: cupin domain-containing protein [Chloroflexota bacterium]|nr:cupin domain-containing protein [Chloroflexota bacterium]